MGHLRRLGGRWSALGGAWPDPKGPGRCLPTPWVPWVRAVPIGPLRWPGGRSRAPESAVLPSGAVVGTHPARPCTCTMRPTQVPELPVAGPHAPRGPTRSLGWVGGGCFGLEGARGACFRSTRQIHLFSRIRGPRRCVGAAFRPVNQAPCLSSTVLSYRRMRAPRPLFLHMVSDRSAYDVNYATQTPHHTPRFRKTYAGA